MSWYYLNLEAFSYALLSILFEGIPFLLLGSIISGIVDVFVSTERVTKLMPKSAVGSVLMAGLMGMAFPICECGSVVVVRRVIRKGLPIGAAISYMLAAPIVSPIVAISTYKAFSGGSIGGADVPAYLITILRLAMGFSIAVIISLIVRSLPHRRILQPGLVADDSVPARAGLRIAGGDGGNNQSLESMLQGASVGRKLVMAIKSATTDFLDVAFFFVIGAALASLFVGFKEATVAPLVTSPFLSIIALMGLAALLCLCSTTDAFVAAAAFSKFSVAANLGFLVFGPMFDMKLFWLYGMIFKRRFVMVMAAGMFALVAFICWQIGRADAFQPKTRPASAQLASP
jgi:uncharacterized membrane protein YraQ (UPF0718 family)